MASCETCGSHQSQGDGAHQVPQLLDRRNTSCVTDAGAVCGRVLVAGFAIAAPELHQASAVRETLWWTECLLNSERIEQVQGSSRTVITSALIATERR